MLCKKCGRDNDTLNVGLDGICYNCKLPEEAKDEKCEDCIVGAAVVGSADDYEVEFIKKSRSSCLPEYKFKYCPDCGRKNGEEIEKVKDIKNFWHFLQDEAMDSEEWWLDGWLDTKLEEYLKSKEKSNGL